MPRWNRRSRRRNRSRSTRRLLRRLIRKKRYGSRYGRKGRMKRVRGVYGRKKTKGWKTRLNTRPETKYTVYLANANIAIRTFANNGTRIWSTGETDVNGNSVISWPVQGNNNGQVEGTKWNSMYIEIIFDIRWSGTPAETAAASFWDTLRFIIVRARDSNTPLPSVNTLFVAQVGTALPINSKLWDIHCDRIYQYTTGGISLANLGTITQVDADPPPNVNQVDTRITGLQTLAPRAKRFRIVMPFRHTFSIVPPNSINAVPNDISIFAYTLVNNNLFTVFNISTTLYYKDP